MARSSASFLTAGFVAASLLVGSSASAAILAVDFNDEVQPDLTQAGFTGVAVGDTTSFTTNPALPGGYTVSLAGIDGSRIRSKPSEPENGVRSIYLDLVFRNDNNATTADFFTLTVAGLKPSTEYDVTFYAYDGNTGGNRSQTYAPAGATAGETKVGTFTTTAPVALGDAATVVRLTTDESGTFSYTITGGASATAGNGLFPVLNGFEVNEIPEPGSMMLFGAGAGLMFLRRRD